MTKLTIRKIRLFIILVSIFTLFGIADTYFGMENNEESAGLFLRRGINWFIGGVLIWGFELFVLPGRYGVAIRKMQFLSAIIVKSIIIVLIIFMIFVFDRLFYEHTLQMHFLVEDGFYTTLCLAFAVILLFQVALQIIRIVGGRTLANIVLGKYRHPVHENKIFMFLDLADSTALAERMGDVGVQSMITRFFFDITEPIIEYSGDIHRYVGDLVIVTWPLRTDKANNDVVHCCFAITDLMRKKAQSYTNDFGTVPKFRIGLHGGSVVSSQCGDQKQEISYYGDTVNTTARIEQQCKELHCDLLISSDLLEAMTLPTKYISQYKGSVRLRGRENHTELLTIVER